MSSFYFHIQGQVQGVGFRPHVFQMAQQYGLKGWVSNGVDGVHIKVTGDEKNVFDFYENLLMHPPLNAIINSSSIREQKEELFSDFQIKESIVKGKPNLLLTPDLGICPDCKSALWNNKNRRFQYAFTTCIQCGPRYSIVKKLPYDRPLTSMESFKMCPKCAEEYSNPLDRRFYSQTNSCPICAVHLYWLNAKGEMLSDQSNIIFEEAVQALREGKILAIKGIGGYLILADATSGEAIQQLRKRKNRPSKPFALLYPSEKMLKGDVWVNEKELASWHSIESPIVLFKVKPQLESGIKTALIAPHLDRIGIMQPYAPILEILSGKFDKPLIATSGNVSGFPIFYKNEEAIKNLGQVADYFLTNDRCIVVPQDDSVFGFSETANQKVVFRRSRGYAPNIIHDGFTTKKNILGMGAMLKSTFSLHQEDNTYISQYLGDTENYDVQKSYKKVLRHLTDVLCFKPDFIVTDRHPDYFSTQFGEMLAEQYKVPRVKIQHHIAHFGAVLAENHLLTNKEPVLGVIWDGTGLGDDNNIWGGEFFIFQNNQFKRAAYFDYFNHLSGDKMAKEPRLSALSLAFQLPGAVSLLNPKFNQIEWDLFSKYLSKQNQTKTSSVGRLFDGIAALLNSCDRQTFEGEAAMQLQSIAQQFYQNAKEEVIPYTITKPSPVQIVEAVIGDLLKGLPKDLIAAKFHLTLVNIIRQMAKDSKVNKIAFSGGVFQNTFLIDLIIAELQNEFELFFHHQLSPNDENISFGQLACSLIKFEKLPLKKKLINSLENS